VIREQGMVNLTNQKADSLLIDPKKNPLLAYLQQVSSVVFKGIKIAPLTFLLTLLVMILVLSSTATISLVVEKLDSFLTIRRKDIKLSIYLDSNYELQDKHRLLNLLKTDERIGTVTFNSKEDALADFKANLGENHYILNGLEANNPLPDSIEVTFIPQFSVVEMFDQYVVKLEKFPGVDVVQFNYGLLSRLTSLAQYFKMFGSVIIPLLLFTAGFIIWVTITLALHSHRHEIEIMRLVGATQTFITLPYALEGILQGILGAFFSIVIVNLFAESLSAFIGKDLWFSLFLDIGDVSLPLAFKLILLGGSVGLLGSSIAVRRFLVDVN
jgi:cell division transport system permease protein